MFPLAHAGEMVRCECETVTSGFVRLRSDRKLQRLIQNGNDRRTGQLDAQHRRWKADGPPR